MAVLPTGIGPVTGGYQIQRSLRFNSADSAYLNRTPASAGNRKTWTWSGWIKLSSSSTGVLFSAEHGGGTDPSIYTAIYYINNRLELQRWNGSGYNIQVSTNNLLRDFSAWYHFLVAVDTTQATSANRVKIYINGIETSYNTATYPTQNFDTDINSTQRHALGTLVRLSPNNFTGFSNQYLTEINFIDGQALTPSDFGETDSATGVWKPKKYTGTYGTNGFYLNFSDNSNTTAATLGKDSSGNGNNWTPNNFSVTAGAGNDSLVDTPTSYGTDTGVGGEVRGNYCTLNAVDKNASFALANGNLDCSIGSVSWVTGRSTFAFPTTGKWYAEGVCNQGSGSAMIGIGTASAGLANYAGADANGWGYYASGTKYNNGSATSYGASYTTNDVIGIAFDADAGTLVFYKNGVSQGTAFSSLTSGPYFVMPSVNNCSWFMNFGQRPFAYTAPSGFKALCTQNLPTPTIGATSTTQAGKYMNAVLWTGDNTNSRTITGVGFQPDLVWAKSRSNAQDNLLLDSVRAGTYNLISNSTAQEAAASAFSGGAIDSTAADGFTVVRGSANGNNVNQSTYTYVAWNWKANGAGSSNTQGTITSTVSANTTAGFSIVTYTGTGANATVGHGLGVAPKMVIVKNRNTAGRSWRVWHTGIANTEVLQLENTGAKATETTAWNSTSPASTVFSIGTSLGTNANTETYVAYCFAEVAGYSAFGSYTGNGSTDGPFVYTGFRPRWIMYKDSSTTNPWVIIDTVRQTYNVLGPYLLPNASDAEGTTTVLDSLSNGFKIRVGTGSSANTTNNVIIYAAFASNPFKFSLAG